jgi:MFS family permease
LELRHDISTRARSMNESSHGFRGTIAKTFISLRNRNFRLFFVGQTISNTGNWLTNVALVLLVLKLTSSGFAVGLVAACQYGPILFLAAWGGAIADRSDKRRLLLVTQSVEMVQSVALAIIAFMPHPSVVALYAVAAAGGIVLALDNPLRRSFVTEMVREEDIGNAVVLYSTVVNVSRVFGPALAGLLIVTLGYGWCFTIDAATYIAVIFCIVIMRASELHRQPPKARTKAEVREGLRYMRSLPVLWITFAMLAAIGTFAYNFNVTLPLFVTRGLHGSEGMFTIFYSVFSVGAVVSALVVAHRGLVQMRHILIGAVAMGVAMLLMGVAPNVPVALPLMFVVGVTSIMFMTATTAIVQVRAKRDMHGRLLALQTVLVAGTGLIGGPVAGWLADWLGGRAPIVFGGVVCLAGAAFGYFADRRWMRQ